jgi:hypothetical protein
VLLSVESPDRIPGGVHEAVKGQLFHLPNRAGVDACRQYKWASLEHT